MSDFVFVLSGVINSAHALCLGFICILLESYATFWLVGFAAL